MGWREELMKKEAQWNFVIMDIVEAFLVLTEILKKPNNTDKSLRTN